VSCKAEINSGCRHCDQLRAQYEAATFDLARIHNALEIAEYLGDRDSRRRLKLAAFQTAERQRNARTALARHQEMEHLAA